MATASIPAPTSTRKPIATSAAVLAYLAAGHTNTDAAAHFGIHERSVRRIKQRAAEGTRTAVLQLNDERAAERLDKSVAFPTSGPTPPPRVFPSPADDVAHDNTYWKCPATGELLPVVPGTHRHAWERERRETHARHVARVMSPSPDWAPEAMPASTGPDMSGHAPLSASESEMSGLDSTPKPSGTGHVRTPPPVAPRLPAGIVRDYLKHQTATVQRDGLLLVVWRWLEAHPLIGPLPSRAVVVLLVGLAVALLAG